MKKYAVLISLGLLNIAHATLHLFQVAQSLVLLKLSTETHTDCEPESFAERLIHNPILSIIWAIIGLITIYIGVKDFIHHKKHD